MKKILATIVILALSPTKLWADHSTVGNGGDVITCRDNAGQITKIELLDFYEAIEFRQMALSLPTEGSEYERAKILFDRLAPLSPIYSQLFKMYVDLFEANTLFKDGIELVDIPDSQHLGKPLGCKVEQIAIQKTPQFPEDKIFTVNNDLWKKLDINHKAGLIVHEVIFRHLIASASFGINSFNTRYLVSLLASNKLANAKHTTLIPLFSSLGICQYKYRQGFIQTTLRSIYPVQNVLHFETQYSSDLNWIDLEQENLKVCAATYPSMAYRFYEKSDNLIEALALYKTECTLNTYGTVKAKNYLKFHDNGQLSEIDLAAEARLTVANRILIANGKANINGDREYSFLHNAQSRLSTITFNKQGEIISLGLAPKQMIENGLSKIETTGESIAELNPDGVISALSGLDVMNLQFADKSFKVKAYYDSQKVHFYKNGIPKIANLLEPITWSESGNNCKIKNTIELYDNARLKNANLMGVCDYNLNGKNIKIGYTDYASIGFYPSGKLKSGAFAKGFSTKLKDINNKDIRVSEGMKFLLTEEGRVESLKSR